MVAMSSQRSVPKNDKICFKIYNFYLSTYCKVENIDKIWLFFGFFQKNEIWPYLVEFGLFLKVIWLCACAKAYQPCLCQAIICKIEPDTEVRVKWELRLIYF